jgi:hypothetical protein
LPVTSIAYSLGYSDVASFTGAFRHLEKGGGTGRPHEWASRRHYAHGLDATLDFIDRANRAAVTMKKPGIVGKTVASTTRNAIRVEIGIEHRHRVILGPIRPVHGAWWPQVRS